MSKKTTLVYKLLRESMKIYIWYFYSVIIIFSHHHRRFPYSDKYSHRQSQGKIIFYRAISQNPYKTLWNFYIRKYTFHSPPMFSYDSWNILQGKTGQNTGLNRAKIFLQGKVDLTPDVSLWFVKIALFTNHSISSGKL